MGLRIQEIPVLEFREIGGWSGRAGKVYNCGRKERLADDPRI